MSPLGLGRVKTPTFNLRAETPSRFRITGVRVLAPAAGQDQRADEVIE